MPNNEGTSMRNDRAQVCGTIQSLQRSYVPKYWTSIGLLCALLSLAASPVRAELFTGIGDLDGSIFNSQAAAISADGMVVVGYGWSAAGRQAVRWTLAGGMVGLGFLPDGFESLSYGLSADGSVIVGDSYSASGSQAFRWSSSEGMVGLGILPGYSSSSAVGVSADGSTVVGGSQRSVDPPGGGKRINESEAFRFTSGEGMVGLGDFLGGNLRSYANAASADGSVIFGNGATAAGDEAFRWTSVDGLVGLGGITGGDESYAVAASPDGSVVVGVVNSAATSEAFRWTSSSGMVGLGDLAGGFYDSSANAVSADGSVVVGISQSALGYEAFIWTAAGGMQSLQDVLVSQFGLDLAGWTLMNATGISADGTKIVGYGTNPNGDLEGWYADISSSAVPEPSSWAMLALAGSIVAGRRYFRRRNRSRDG